MSHVFKIGIAAQNNKEIKEVNHIDVIANKGVVSERVSSVGKMAKLYDFFTII